MKFTGRVFQEQRDEDRDAAVERPHRALSWRTSSFEEMTENGHMTYLA